MIRKPPGTERESTAHAAVGRVIDAGADVGEAAKRGWKAYQTGAAWYVGIGMGFALIMSATPIWFKGAMLALGYGAYRLLKGTSARA